MTEVKSEVAPIHFSQIHSNTVIHSFVDFIKTAVTRLNCRIRYLQQIWSVYILLLKVQKILLQSSLSPMVFCFLLVYKLFPMDFLNVRTEQTSPLKTTGFPCRMFLLCPQYFQDFITVRNLQVCQLSFCMLSFPPSTLYSAPPA